MADAFDLVIRAPRAVCDGYACAAEARNDLASAVIPGLVRLGMTLRTNTVCVRLVRTGSRVTDVECVNRVTGQRERISADRVILGAGTLATPIVWGPAEIGMRPRPPVGTGIPSIVMSTRPPPVWI